MFFERHLKDVVENFVPDATDPAQLNEALELSRNFVRCKLFESVVSVRACARVSFASYDQSF